MMWMILCVGLAGAPLADSDWRLDETEIYQALERRSVAVHESGIVYVVDTKECQVLKINEKGDIEKRFGKKGQGPGEFTFPGQVIARGDRFYLRDSISRNLLAFDLDGNFITSWKMANQIMSFDKAAKGWVYGTWSGGFGGQKKAGALKWMDDDLKNDTIWFNFQTGKSEEKAPGGLNLEIKDGYATLPFNPADDTPRAITLPNGRYVMLVHPGPSLKWDIFDTATGKVLKSEHVKSQPIPFNKQWGDALIEKRNKATEEKKSSGSFKVKYSADFPEYFPYVRKAWGFADNHFYLQAWSGNPNKQEPLIKISVDGKSSKTDLDPEVAMRLFHLNDTHGWVGLFDAEEEQAGIAKVPRKHLKAFLKENPIEEGEKGSFVMVMD